MRFRVVTLEKFPGDPPRVIGKSFTSSREYENYLKFLRERISAGDDIKVKFNGSESQSPGLVIKAKDRFKRRAA